MAGLLDDRFKGLGATLYREIDEETEAYGAVGRFILAYASAEIAVHQTARKLSGLKDTKARLIFGGMRIGDAVSRIRALLATSRKSEKNKLKVEECLIQFDLIGDVRDKLVHRTSHHMLGMWSVTNILTAKSVTQAEHDKISVSDLKAMASDCLSIYLILATIFSPRSQWDALDRTLLQIDRPWLYKRAPQSSGRRRSHRQKK